MCNLYSTVSHTQAVGCVEAWGTDRTNDSQRAISCRGSFNHLYFYVYARHECDVYYAV